MNLSNVNLSCKIILKLPFSLRIAKKLIEKFTNAPKMCLLATLLIPIQKDKATKLVERIFYYQSLTDKSFGGSGIAPVKAWRDAKRLTNMSVDDQIK